jgi:hypothetical protein
MTKNLSKLPSNMKKPPKGLEYMGPVPYYKPLDQKQRREIIAAYGQTLEKCCKPVEREADLPFPKGMIRQAIFEELLENPATDIRAHLEVGYVRLESFIPSEEYQILQDFKSAGALAESKARAGNPESIVASARVLKSVKGDEAMVIQEKISKQMRLRMEQIRMINRSLFKASSCRPARS